MDKKIDSKKVMYYSMAVLAVVILLKLLVAISWKLIFLSLAGLGVWFVFGKIIKPKFNKWRELEQL